VIDLLFDIDVMPGTSHVLGVQRTATAFKTPKINCEQQIVR